MIVFADGWWLFGSNEDKSVGSKFKITGCGLTEIILPWLRSWWIKLCVVYNP